MKIVTYIVDQNHEVQRASLPSDAIPGFVVQVFSADKNGRPKKLQQSMWNKTRAQAEMIAQEYIREYAIKEACGWS